MATSTNVLLIAVDTLRADHLGCYGYNRATSPHIDALARQGALVENFFCAGLPTQPSFTTLYTGQHPVTHGVVAHGGKAQLAKDAPFLPQAVLAEGYTTCAFDNLAQGRAWFRRGYEFYIDPSVRHSLFLDVSCEELNARAIPWIHQHADESFFLFIHYWDPHWPLTPPARYRDLFYDGNPCDPNNHSLDSWWEEPLGALARETWLRRAEGPVTDDRYLEALYDQEIRHLDDGIAALLSALNDAGLTDDTLVILLGDHGESITEHRIFLEHRGLYDCTLHVPFIARLPGRIPAGQRISALTQHHDVAPTILDALEIDTPPEMDGLSFWGDLTGQGAPLTRDYVVSCESTWQAKWSLRTRTHKLIIARDSDRYGGPDRELYDLVADPGEECNLVDAEPDRAQAMETELEEWIAEKVAEAGRDADPVQEQGASLSGVIA